MLALSTFKVSAEAVIDICQDDASKSAVHKKLKRLLKLTQQLPNGGYAFHLWGSVVNRDGKVCAVVFTGEDRGDQWPGSRNIAIAKAHTANAFALPDFAISSANFYESVQPGGSLWGVG